MNPSKNTIKQRQRVEPFNSIHTEHGRMLLAMDAFVDAFDKAFINLSRTLREVDFLSGKTKRLP